MKILILDDQQHHLDSLVDGLSDLNLEIQATTDQKKALDLIEHHSQDYAVLLIDVHMPIMNGFEVAQKINSFHLESYPPIVFLTALQCSQQNIHCGYSNGAIDYLLKPIDLFILKSKISIFKKLHKKQSENRDLTQILSQKISELETANKNLRSFSSIATHDLKIPIRQIHSFSEIMINEVVEKEYSLDYLHRIQQCTLQMKRIIQDINIFSHHGLEKVNKKISYSEEIIKIGKALLQKEINKYNAEINILNHDYLYCDKEKMALVFQNIIQNSIKYKHPQKKPIIQISIQKDSEKTIISFEDNGVGIPKNKKKEIFNFMTRLHNQKDIPGTGVGLTICEHIISTHGGRIWVDSELHNGSTFFITIPNIQEKITLDGQ